MESPTGLPAATAAWKSAKPCRMDGAKRSQSNLDRPSLRSESPGPIGTAGSIAVCPDSKQVAAPTQVGGAFVGPVAG